MKVSTIATLVFLTVSAYTSGKDILSYSSANLVLGQPGFNTGTYITPISQSTLRRPGGVAVDPSTGIVFVSDYSNSRVLRYANASTLENGDGAEVVLGQSQFSDSVAKDGIMGVGTPMGIFFDKKGRLWVCDVSNNRVLMFENASARESGSSADRVYGQPNFGITTQDVSNAKFYGPHGVFVDSSDNLWVADTGNNRVLRFNSITTKPSGAAADAVLGQTNFTSNSPATNITSMSHPTAIAISKTGILFVADAENHRVLRFDESATLASGAQASAVLGQSSFNTTSGGLTASAVNYAGGLALGNDGTLWVADYSNFRVMGFKNAPSLSSNSPANIVLGQPNFTSSIDATNSRGSLKAYGTLFAESNGNLWIPDMEHSRVLRFSPDSKKPSLSVTSTVPKTTTQSKLIIKGTASDSSGISAVKYTINSQPKKSAKGTKKWQFTAALAKGKNKIIIYVTDDANNTTTTDLTVKRN